VFEEEVLRRVLMCGVMEKQGSVVGVWRGVMEEQGSYRTSKCEDEKEYKK
jgi:hypothetical protein